MVCPYSLSRPGGVQGQATALARALREKDLQVTVVAPDDVRQVGLHGDTYVAGRSTGIRSNGSVAPVALSPLAAARVTRFAESGSTDLVHIHEPLAPVLGYGCLLHARLPTVGTYHRAGSSGWYRALGPVARWADGRLDARCAVSDAAAATVHEALGVHCDVLFNGIEVDRFRDAVPWPKRGPTVLFLGRHEARKGLGVLLDAFATLTEGPVLWIAGDGPEDELLTARASDSDRVEWLGVLTDREVARRLAAADVLCAPSLGGESFGMVLVEAMAARCVVVASDIAGYRDAAGGHAILTPPGDAHALAAALGSALGEATSGTGHGAPGDLDASAGRAERWSMAALADRYLEIYARAVASHGHR